MGSSEEELDCEIVEELKKMQADYVRYGLIPQRNPDLVKSAEPDKAIYKYNITISAELIADLVRIEKRIKELTDGDGNLINNIIKYSLLVGKNKGIYIYHINHFIYEKYPDINTNYQIQEKRELFSLIYELIEILTGDQGLEGALCEQDILSEDDENFIDQFREIVEKQINGIFCPGSTETDKTNSCTDDIIGEITEPTNDIGI